MKRVYAAGIILGLLSLILRLLFGAFPQWAESVYGHGIYPAVRFVLDSTIGRVPFSLGGLPLLIVLTIVVTGIVKLVRGRTRLKASLLKTFGILGFAAFWFMFAWGFNYARANVISRLNWQVEELPENHWEAIYQRAMQDALAARKRVFVADSLPVTQWVNPSHCKYTVLSRVREICHNLGYSGSTHMPIRYARPGGILRRLGIAGIYNPFTGEPNIDASYTPLPRMFTSAHEMAHACGVTDEGDANFVAWMATRTADCKLANYAAEYKLWRQLARAMPPNLPDSAVERIAASIPAPLLTDRQALRAERSKFMPVAPELSKKINDSYLKAQGVKKGVASYNRLAVLALAWKKQNEREGSPAAGSTRE